MPRRVPRCAVAESESLIARLSFPRPGLVQTHLAGGTGRNLGDWQVDAKVDDGSQIHLTVVPLAAER